MVGKRRSRKTTHNRGCGLCSPWKRMGNSKARFSAHDLRAAESAKAQKENPRG